MISVDVALHVTSEGHDDDDNDDDTSSVQSIDRLGRRVDMTDDSEEILFQPFLQQAIVGKFWRWQGCVHSVVLST